MKSNNKISIALILTLSLNSIALADIESNSQTDSKNEKGYKLDKVTATVTTASGYEQQAKNAPASISVIDKEEILERPIRDLGDAVQDVPGVYVEASKTGANTISIRGLDSSYTLVLIDGKRQNVAQGFNANGISADTSFMPPASMIERIEVIRGPASIIYGSDAMGGVINIITKKNIDKVSMSMQSDVKLHEKSNVFGNIMGLNAYLAAPIIKDKLTMNLRGAYKMGGANTFLKPSNVTQGNNPYLGWSATGFQNANVGTRINYILDSNNSFYFDSDMNYARLGSLNTSSASVTAIRDFYKFNEILNYDGDYSFGKINSYLQYSQTFWAGHVGTPVGGSSGTSINWAGKTDNKNIVFQATYNQLFDFNNWGELVVNGGFNYIWEQLTKTNVKRAMNQVAVFAEGQWLINDYIGMTLGLRYNYSDIFTALPNPRFYINYNPTDWLTFKAGIASGVRNPNLSYLYDSDSTSGGNTTYYYGNPDLKPESSWNYEFSSIIDTDYIFAVATGYYTDFVDQIETVPYTGGMCAGSSSSNTCRTYRNLDKSLMAGAEIGFKLKPIYGFSLDTNYAFTYTKVLSAPSSQSYLIGESVNSIPRHSMTISPKYVYKDFDIYLRLSGKFQTPTPASNPAQTQGNTDQTRRVIGQYYKDYVLCDIAANYKINKNWTITLAVNNLFDTNFIDLVEYTSSTNTTNVMNNYQRILPSRNYWLAVRAEI